MANSNKKTPETPQLLIKKFNLKANIFAHCLICSTAPKNAENRYREELYNDKHVHDHDLLVQGSLEKLDQLKRALQEFIDRYWDEQGVGILDKIKIIFQIHGFNVPLSSVEKEYNTLQQKFDQDTAGKAATDYNDFVIFVNFSWPSEQVIASQLGSLLTAFPIALWLVLIAAALLVILSWPNMLAALGLVLAGLPCMLLILRLAVYFRDRDRAASFGVFDVVELVRWLGVIIQDLLQKKSGKTVKEISRVQDTHDEDDSPFFGAVQLSFIAHSMGCFVTTQAIRVLSDVFDPNATGRWNQPDGYGPFSNQMPTDEPGSHLRQIGNLFSLKSLILASPDIPVWAIATGRSNFLQSCIRRFEEVFFFTNNADMVLRVASTAANYFVFPSNSRIGGYRLGNLTVTCPRKPGLINHQRKDLGIRTFFRKVNLQSAPFWAELDRFPTVTVVDCTDYTDATYTGRVTQRRLSAFTANNAFTDLGNYCLTALFHILQINQLDSHGGYFRGKFCLDLIYGIALQGGTVTRDKLNQTGEPLDSLLKQKQITWIAPTEPPSSALS